MGYRYRMVSVLNRFVRWPGTVVPCKVSLAAPKPPAPLLLNEEGVTGGDCRGRRKHRPRPIFTIFSGHQVFRCSMRLEMSDRMEMDKVYITYYG